MACGPVRLACAVACLNLAACGGGGGGTPPPPPPTERHISSVAWQDLSGPLGGFVPDLTQCPSGTWVAAGEADGLFRSVDDGVAWSNVSTAVRVRVRCDGSGTLVAVGNPLHVSSDDGVTWATRGVPPSGQGLLLEPMPSGDWIFVRAEVAADATVWRSTDDGANWVQVGTIAGGEWPESLLATSSSTLLVGTREGSVFRSVDGGTNWSSVLTSSRELDVMRQLPGSRLVVASTDDGGIDLSVDDGQSWSPVDTTDLDALFPGSAPISEVGASGGSDLIAVVGAALYRSTDLGATWVLDAFTVHASNGKRLAQATDGDLLFSTSYGIWRGPQGGSASMVGLAVGRVSDVLRLSDGSVVASASGGAPDVSVAVRSAVSGDWTLGGFIDLRAEDILQLPSGDLRAALTDSFDALDGALGVSADGGATWSLASPGTSESLVDLIRSSATLYACSANGAFSSSDEGSTWIALTAAGLPGGPNDLAGCRLVRQSGHLIMATAAGIYSLPSGAGSWEAVEPTGIYVAVAPGTSGEFYAALVGSVTRYQLVSGSWSVSADFGQPSGVVALAPDGESGVVVAGSNRLWHIPEGSTSIFSVQGQLSGQTLLDISLGDDGLIYAGTESGGAFVASPTWVD
jgi:hypothetical protein